MRWIRTALVAIAALSLAALPSTSSRQDYTGNGATTVFAFSFKAAAAAHVAVYVATVKQTSGVTVALNANQETSPGGSVTFASAPAAGALVRIQRETPRTQETVFQPYSAFPAKTTERALDRATMHVQELERRLEDSINTGTFPVDTSSVTALGSTTPRSLAARAADEVDLRDFGATPDDGTDDTVAIQAAVLSGKPMRCTGSYNMSFIQTRVAKFRLRGEGGCTLVSNYATGTGIGSFSFLGDVALTEFTLRDLAITNSVVDLSLADPGMVSGSLVTIINNAKNVTIENVTLDSAQLRAGGMLIASGETFNHQISNVIIRGNRVTGPIGGITVYSGNEDSARITDVLITGNIIYGNGLMDDILSSTPTTMGISIAGWQKRVTISDNIIRDYPYAGIELATRAAGTEDYTIQGNYLKNTGWGIIFDPGGNSAVRFSNFSVVGNVMEQNRRGQRFNFLKNSTIANNVVTVKDVDDGAPYTARAAARPGTFVQFEYGEGNTVSGNVIDLDLPAAEKSKTRVNLSQYTDSVFTGNRFRTTGNYVVWFHNGAGVVERNSFTANTFYSAPIDASASEACVRLDVGASKNTFNANTFYSNNVLTLVQGTGVTGNYGSGSVLYRTDTGYPYKQDSVVVYAASGATLDLRETVELHDTVQIIGSPAAPVAVTIPSGDRVVTFINGTGQTLTVGQATGVAQPIPAGMTMRLRVQDGFVLNADSATIYSANGSGQNAFAVVNNGARLDLGTGANDHLRSDGTSVITDGPFTSSGTLTTGMLLTAGGTNSLLIRGVQNDAGTSVGVSIGNSVTLTTAGAKIARFCADNPTSCTLERASVNKDGTITSAAASSTNGFALATSGARIDFGAGASDYASSNGTTVTFASPVAITGALTGVTTASASSTITSTTGASTNGFALTTNGARVDLGTGASDYLASDGTNIQTGPIILGIGGVAVTMSPAWSTVVDLASIPATSCAADQAVTVTGAAAGAECSLGLPSALPAGLLGSCFVSATSTVQVRICNQTTGAIDPPALTYRVRVFNP